MLVVIDQVRRRFPILHHLSDHVDHRIKFPQEQRQHHEQMEDDTAENEPRCGCLSPQPPPAPEHQCDETGRQKGDPQRPLPQVTDRQPHRIKPTRIPTLLQLDLASHAVVQPVPTIPVGGEHQPKALGRHSRLGFVVLGIDHRPEVLGRAESVVGPAGPVKIQVDRFTGASDAVGREVQETATRRDKWRALVTARTVQTFQGPDRCEGGTG